MDIRFLKNVMKDQPVLITCPICQGEHAVRYGENRRTSEVCPACTRPFSVHIYTGGMVVVE
jgi:transposase-like protein